MRGDSLLKIIVFPRLVTEETKSETCAVLKVGLRVEGFCCQAGVSSVLPPNPSSLMLSCASVIPFKTEAQILCKGLEKAKEKTKQKWQLCMKDSKNGTQTSLVLVPVPFYAKLKLILERENILCVWEVWKMFLKMNALCIILKISYAWCKKCYHQNKLIF